MFTDGLVGHFGDITTWLMQGSYSSRKEGRNEGNVLFNNTLNTFYFQLYGVKSRGARDVAQR